MRAATSRVLTLLLHRKLAVLLVLGSCAIASLTVHSLGRQQAPEAEHLRVIAANADTWKHDGKPRLILRSPVQWAAYRGRVPDTLFLDIQLDNDFREVWEIWRVDLVEIAARGTEKLVESIQCVDNPASRFHAKEYLTGLRGKDHSYAVVVFLHAHGDVDEQAIDSAKRAVMDGRGVTIKDVMQPWSQPTPSVF